MREEDRIADEQAAVQAVAQAIRERSRAGSLTPGEELHRYGSGRGFLGSSPGEPAAAAEGFLKKALAEQEDLRELLDRDGAGYYYSARFMTDVYAQMLLQKKEDPVSLMARVVRDASALYPRPVPLVAFQEAPFALSPEEIRACLQQMSKRDEFRDLAQTRTSIGTIFLYSTSHLEPAHASMLAEWLEVGGANSP